MSFCSPIATELGKVVEAVAAEHCRRLKLELEPNTETQLFYWKNTRHEIDIVINIFQKPLPIEVKYKDKIDPRDLAGLEYFAREYKVPIRIAITKQKLGLDGNTIMIPLWLFLLI